MKNYQNFQLIFQMHYDNNIDNVEIEPCYRNNCWIEILMVELPLLPKNRD